MADWQKLGKHVSVFKQLNELRDKTLMYLSIIPNMKLFFYIYIQCYSFCDLNFIYF